MSDPHAHPAGRPDEPAPEAHGSTELGQSPVGSTDPAGQPPADHGQARYPESAEGGSSTFPTGGGYGGYQSGSGAGSEPGPGFEAGQPSSNPRGFQPSGYDQPSYAPPGYGQSGYDPSSYGQQAYPAHPYAPPGSDQSGYAAPAVWTVYGTWSKRAGAYLIDFLPSLLGQLIFFAGYLALVVDVAQSPNGVVAPSSGGALTMLTGLLIGLVALIWQIYNRWVVAGRTGQSLGKRVFRLSLVSEDTGQPIGPLNAFLRDLVHILDNFFWVGYLWPLWDEKKQTFSDKILKTVVLDKS